ncbi:MAG: hypothetical protein M3Y54_15195 [Bacteroidota bacterium]|nr:hypothetical protein [Bacteroidota bacterium]
MRTLTCRLLAFVLLYAASLGAARATHLFAAELTYEYAGTGTAPFQYRVIARYSSNSTQNAIPPPTQVQLTCNPNGCTVGTSTQYVQLMRISPVAPVVLSCMPTTNTYNDVLLEGLVNLPPANWRLSIELAPRSPSTVNLPPTATNGTVVLAELNNLVASVNSSPRFTATRQVWLPGLQPQHYSFNAFDPDGDSLSYELMQPLLNNATAEICGTPSTGALAPYFQLNPATGELQPTAGTIQQGGYVMAGRVNEFRRINGAWLRIGSVWRDDLYYLIASANQVPIFTNVTLGGSPRLGQTIRAVAGQAVELQISAADPDAGQTVTLSSGAVGIVPGLSLQPQSGGQGLLRWQVPATLPAGRYTFTVTGVDDACPSTSHSVLTLTFMVTQPLATRARQALAQAPWPNPFQEVIEFQLAGQGAQPVLVADATGRTVVRLTSAPDGRVRWQPAPGVVPGLYFARTVDGRQMARLAYSGQ